MPDCGFQNYSAKKNNDKTYNRMVNGDLTVKGKTNPVSFPANVTVKDGVVTLTSNKFSLTDKNLMLHTNLQ
ncbi:YceI family protein [Chryseobacterium indoltheticum]|uniref:YceI family protein n=1 Tax=Chryseobacterium indoltheticum TaxID=254 RepID=UPI003F498CFA